MVSAILLTDHSRPNFTPAETRVQNVTAGENGTAKLRMKHVQEPRLTTAMVHCQAAACVLAKIKAGRGGELPLHKTR